MISVLLPVYNAARFLEEAVRSMLAQTEGDFELIAVDDGSTDTSLPLLAQLAREDGRIRVISRPNTGIVGALNDGLAQARGEWVARMDADDWAHPARLAAQLHFLTEHPEVVACGTFVHFVDPWGRPVKPCARPTDHATLEAMLLDGDGGALIHPSVMLRTEVLKQVGGYREKAQWVEDLDLYLRLAEVGQLANVPRYLLHYRQHPASVNATRSNNLRREAKEAVMAEAHERRGTSWEGLRQPAFWPTPAEQWRDWATESLGYGDWGRSMNCALRGVATAPLHRASWRTLKYVAQYGRGLAKKARHHPNERYQLEPLG